MVCRNEEEARKDAETRTALIAGLERKLAQGDKALVANAGYRRFLAAPTGKGFAIDPDKVAADAQFDGLFVLRTNMKLSALAVEQSFLAAKTLLATRPVFHRTDAAIRGHIGCTFLGPPAPQGVARPSGKPPYAGTGMATHNRRPARSQRRRHRAGRPPRPAAYPTQAEHRSDMPRPWTHTAALLSGDAARPRHTKRRLNRVVPKNLMR